MTGLTTDQAALMDHFGAGRTCALLRVATPTPLNLWTGIGDFETTADDALIPVTTFDGCGILRGMPVVSAMRSGQFDTVNFALAGGAGIPQAMIDDPVGTGIQDARAFLGVVGFDADWQAIAAVAWFWAGRVGYVGSAGEDTGARTVSLSISTGNALRARAKLNRWSNANHQSRHPGDRFCERTALYRIFYPVKWP